MIGDDPSSNQSCQNGSLGGKKSWATKDGKPGNGYSALHDVVRNGHFDIVELIIREHPRLTSLTNNAGESPLFLAVDRVFYKIALHILEEAVNVPGCSYGGRNKMNLLHVAVIGTGQGKSNKYSQVYQHLVCLFVFFFFKCWWDLDLPITSVCKMYKLRKRVVNSFINC